MDPEFKKLLEEFNIPDPDDPSTYNHGKPPIPVDKEMLRQFYHNQLDETETNFVADLIARYWQWKTADDEVQLVEIQKEIDGDLDHLSEEEPPIPVNKEILRQYARGELDHEAVPGYAKLIGKYRSWHDASISAEEEVLKEDLNKQ